MNSRNWLVDLVHKIGEECALCDHLAEKLDEPQSKQLYCATLELRRKDMLLLANSVKDPNFEHWCEFKHAVKAFTLAMECYDANPTEDMLKSVEASENILASAMSLFLGLEFSDCARCLYDKLLANYNEIRKENEVNVETSKRV